MREPVLGAIGLWPSIVPIAALIATVSCGGSAQQRRASASGGPVAQQVSPAPPADSGTAPLEAGQSTLDVGVVDTQRVEFRALVLRELGALQGGLTPLSWLAEHPGDGLQVFRHGEAEGDTAWCARSVRRFILVGGDTAVRYAYFYPPDPPASLALPSDSGRGLLERQCGLGTIWVETKVSAESVGGALAAQLRDSLSQVYGAMRPYAENLRPGVPMDSARDSARRAYFARQPYADVWALGISFYGSAGWRVPGRWQRDSAVVVSAFDRGLRSMAGEAHRVLAYAYLPVSGYGSRGMAGLPAALAQDAAVAGENTRLAAKAAGLSGIDRNLADRLLALKAEADSASLGGPDVMKAEVPRVLAETGPVLRAWISAAGRLTSARRAAAYLAADLVIGSDAFGYVIDRDTASPAQRILDSLGAHFEYQELGGGLRYNNDFGAIAQALDRDGLAGQLATLAHLRQGNCDGRRVISDGLRLLQTTTDSAISAEVHFLVADAYADDVALAAGVLGEDLEGAPSAGAARAARASAIEQYEQGLALDRSSRLARAAWRTTWRLLAGLPPVSTRFYCAPD